jgi:hypothetical protein
VILAETAELHVEVDGDLPGGLPGPPGPRLETLRPLSLVPPFEPIEALPGDLPAPTHLGDRVPRPFRLEEHLQPELRHSYLPQGHTHLPVSSDREVASALLGRCHACPRNVL